LVLSCSGKGAARSRLLETWVADTAFITLLECGREWEPLRLILEILVEPLVAEVHVLVTPLRCNQLSRGLDLSNELLGAIKLLRLVHRVDLEKDLTSGHCLKSLLQVESCRVFHGAGILCDGLETKLPGEDWGRLSCAVLLVLGEVRQSHRPGIVSLTSKVLQSCDHERIDGRLNVVNLAVLEEVQAKLSIEAVFSNNVGGVD